MKFSAAILILFFGYALTYAHNCATFSRFSDKEHLGNLQKVDVIFYGEIISITPVGNQVYQIKFKVLRFWKGVQSEEITAKYFNPCGRILTLGEKKIVYGYSLIGEGFIDVNCCNFGLFDDERMKREFGEGKNFAESKPPTVSESFLSKLWNEIITFFS